MTGRDVPKLDGRREKVQMARRRKGLSGGAVQASRKKVLILFYPGAGESAGNSPSQRAITTQATQFPRTVTAVRPISISWSIAKSRNNGSMGKLNEVAAPKTISSEARATPAVPLLLIISFRIIKTC